MREERKLSRARLMSLFDGARAHFQPKIGSGSHAAFAILG